MSSLLAYKAATAGTAGTTTRVIVTLEIPADARHNMDRKDVVNKATAKHRVDRVIVKDIEDEDGNHYPSATTAYHSEKLVYTVGPNVLIDPKYDTNPNLVCAGGIHVFLTRRVAEQYQLDSASIASINGTFEIWYDNGVLAFQQMMKNGKPHGLVASWYYYGQINSKVEYNEGRVVSARFWSATGQLIMETRYDS